MKYLFSKTFAAVAAAVLLVIFAASHANAQAECGVGTKVEFEEGRGGIGTIVEIGTKSPHVGWYRIVQNWSPNGEWYPPERWPVYVAGTKHRCGQRAGNAVKPVVTTQPPTKSPASSPATASATNYDLPAGCPFVEPPGTVTRTSPANAALFKRVIYDRAAAKINPDSISAPKKVGLTFVQFSLQPAYKNTLTSSRPGDKRRHDGAPVGAMIYPLKTVELQCDLHGAEIRRSVTEKEYSCFKNKDGDWTCPGRTTKFVENRLIPSQ